MKISREKFEKMSKEELVILINQELNDDHEQETIKVHNDSIAGYTSWKIPYVLRNKTDVLNKSLIKIID